MKIIAINGSPRKNWNTHILLEKCLEGAKEAGAETELINLYDIDFKGCRSCFACKLKGVTLSKCATKDDLEPVLQKISDCDALVLGSPVYLGNVSGEMKSFLERLLFPHMSYEFKPSTFGKKIKTAFIYTMNAPSFLFLLAGYNKFINYYKKKMKKILGYSESLVSTSTYQFTDYSKYAITVFNGKKRLKRREKVFPKDCNKAFLLGKKLVKK
jgi:multimeric flavodoxin WrbA